MSTLPQDDESNYDVIKHRPYRFCCYHVKLSNVAQRLLSSFILAPLITYFLWKSPAFATTTACSVVVSLSCYEYSWLAHRIHTRWIKALSLSESNQDRMNYPTPTIDDCNIQDEADEIQEEAVAFQGKRCAISNLADRDGYGYEWIIGILIAMVGTILSTTIFAFVVSVPSFDKVDFTGFQIYYSIISSFVAWICACFCPDWKYGVILLIEKEIFMVLTLVSMQCPINHFQCTDAISPATFLRICAILIISFRCMTTTTRPLAAVYLHLLLDFTGSLYILGSLFFIVNFVDVNQVETYRKIVIVLLYVVWASDCGAYIAGKCMEFIGYRHTHPLVPHLSRYKDYEGTIIAMVFGILTMFISCHVFNIDGSISEKLMSAGFAVIMGRIGDLFESLIKRAAKVKDSGLVIPGHGGILDRIDALMFSSIVFSRYLSAIVVTGDGLPVPPR